MYTPSFSVRRIQRLVTTGDDHTGGLLTSSFSQFRGNSQNSVRNSVAAATQIDRETEVLLV